MQTNSSSILILEQYLLNYRIPIYRLLSKEYEVSILYWNLENNVFLKTINPSYEDIKTTSVTTLNFFNKFYIPFYPIKVVIEKDKILIVRGNVRNISLYFLLIFRKIFGYKTIVWGQGRSRNRVFNPKKNFLDLLNLFFIKISDAFIFYDSNTREKLQEYTDSNKLFVAKNTIDFNQEMAYYNEIKDNEDYHRKKIKFTTELNFCFIGRLDKRKRLDRVFQYFDIIQRIKPDSTLWIIGTGPEKSKVINWAKHNKNIQYVGSQYGLNAARYLYFCDGALMPGWMGLAVNHCLFYGTPIFSECKNEDLIGHAPEGHFVVNGKNGYIIHENNDEQFNMVIQEFLDRLKQIKLNARNYSLTELSPTLMLNGINEAINYTIK